MDATIHDPGLNASFASGFNEGRAVTDTDDWRYVLGLWFEGTQITLRVFEVSNLPGMMKVMADHLAQGPGASVTVDTVASADLEKATKSLVDLARRSAVTKADIVDAELVSDD